MTDRWIVAILFASLATGTVRAQIPRAAIAPPGDCPDFRASEKGTVPLDAGPRFATVDAPVALICRLPPTEPSPSVEVPSPLPDAEPETLDQAWIAARTFDQNLAAKRSDVASAEQYLGMACAARWPKAGVETSYQVRSARPAFSSRFLGLPVPTDVFPYAQREGAAVRTSIELPLYTSGRITHGIDAAAADVSGSSLDVDRAALDLRMTVAAEYVAVLHAQRELEIIQSSVKRLESHARDVQLLYDHGRVPRNDRLAAEVALANVQQEAIRAGNRLDLARAALNRRLGRPLEADVRIAELPETGPAADLDALTALAVRRRPEIAVLSARIRAVSHRADAVRAARLPQVSLRGDYAFEENRYRAPEGIAAVGVGVTWDVFDGGRRGYEATGLLCQAESLRRVQADVTSSIQLEVRQAWLDVGQTRRRIEVTRQALDQAEENLRVAASRYRSGLAINTEVLDAESLRTQAYGNHYRAIYDAALASLRLQYATGELGATRAEREETADGRG
ncbi:MAG: TolC family protein [Pirellulales bacterium]|nr:TolC family protein [Pirellulales bacterium]